MEAFKTIVKALRPQQDTTQGLTLTDLLNARQIVRRAYLKNAISLEAVLKSELESQNRIAVMALGSVKTRGHIA